MAYLEAELTGDVYAFIRHLDEEMTRGSLSLTKEMSTQRSIGEARMFVIGYERFSLLGGNRVALTFSVLAVGDRITLTAVATGGSQAVLFKINTLGEHSFLDKASKAIRNFSG